MSCLEIRSGIGRKLMFLLLLTCMIITATTVVSATEKKVETEITLTLNPEKPGADEGFYLTGVLTTKDGEPLGNKWLELESTAAGARPGNFDLLRTTTTTIDGYYEFYRPPASPPETLRVVYNGNYVYNATMSKEVSVKQPAPILT